MAACGYLLGRAALPGGLSPFAMGFFGATLGLRRRSAPAVALATGLGALARGWPAMAGLLAGAGLVVLLWALWRRLRGEPGPLSTAGLVGLGAMTARLAGGTAGGVTPYDLVASAFDGVLAAGLYRLFGLGVLALSVPPAPARRAGAEPVALAALAGGALLGCAGLRLAGVPLGSVAAGAVSAGLALLVGPAAGAAGGVLAGAAASLAGGLAPVPGKAAAIVGAEGLAGLLAGAFRELGRPGVFGGYLGVRLAMAVLDPALAGPGLVGAAAGAGLLLALPRRWLRTARVWLSGWRVGPPAPELAAPARDGPAARLAALAEVCREAAATADPEPAEAGEVPRPSEQVKVVSRRLCRGCPRYQHCWEEHLPEVYPGAVRLLESLQAQGTVDVPDGLRRHCRYLDDFVHEARQVAELGALERRNRRAVAEVRLKLRAQLDGIGQVLAGLANEMIAGSGDSSPDTVVASRLRDAGLPLERVQTRRGPTGRVALVVTRPPCDTGDECRTVVASEAGEAAGVELAMAEPHCTWRLGAPTCSFTLSPRPRLGYAVGADQAPKAGQQVCGDSYRVLESEDGRLLVLLSDGMGSGGPAAAESRRLVSLVERLWRAGLPPDAILRLVDAGLAGGPGRETFATVDLAVCDLVTGRAEVVKRGAAPSYLVTARGIRALRSAALPVGVVAGAEATTREFDVAPGDLLVLATDGLWCPGQVPGSGKDRVRRRLEEARDREPAALARLLVQECRAGGGPQDDATVVVVGFTVREAAQG